MAEETKLCVNCIHHKYEYYTHRCRVAIKYNINPVTGEQVESGEARCNEERGGYNKLDWETKEKIYRRDSEPRPYPGCGVEGKLFVPKPAPKTVEQVAFAFYNKEVWLAIIIAIPLISTIYAWLFP